MKISEQLPALLGVMVGAVVSYAFTSLAERGRWKRGLSIRWDERRLTAYVEFVNAVKTSANIVVLILAGRGVLTANKTLSEAEGLPMLADAEGERSLRFDAVLMLGDTDTIGAATELNRRVWRLHSFARGELPVDEEIWAEAFTEYRRARVEFHHAARKNMGVPAATLRQESAWLGYAAEVRHMAPEDA
ncbi:MAG TPA: hypothetical protein VFT95_13645 [Micromonosporaceae bacterium]|nr:hypothetical protein [Micromonosporaceae bacterium]